MQIALLDDESRFNEQLYHLITDYAALNDYDICCEQFTSGRELVQREKFDYYFLDYIMDELDGIETAKLLNEKFSNSVSICFLTNYESAAKEVINSGIFAEGFLTKPVEPEKLYEKIDSIYHESSFKRIAVKKGSGTVIFFTKDILYLESRGKSTVIHTADASEEFLILLKDFENEYLVNSELFFRIHRSFTVNLEHVAEFDRRSVTLKNGTVLPMRNTDDFRRRFREYNVRLNSRMK